MRQRPLYPSSAGSQGVTGAGTVAVASTFGAGAASSAWLGEAKPTAVAVSVPISRAPAMLRRRNPLAVARAVTLAVAVVWMVFVEGLDLRRDLRAIWMGARTPPAGAARDLLNHIAPRR
ncbi:hypothetical protein A5712_04485 [Mycobacterium sp. E2327]|nr:hypothetical protein [Mycobacterium sp. E2327]OBI13868.1 hypothetical protein A5712_04485 [Mycobacterium sp. E2327]